jgi:hypothetical protein
MSLVEVEWHYGKNESRTCSKILESRQNENSCFFLYGSLLGTQRLQGSSVCAEVDG